MVTGAFSATGVRRPPPPGTFTGTLTGTALSGNATGTLHTSGGGDCAFSGPLTAAAQTTFTFKFATRVPAGSFDFLNSPSIVPPVFPVGYAAAFRALFDSNFPDPSAVRFTGPTGSGLSGTPADPAASDGDDTGSNFTYRSPFRSGIAPGGAWSVLYKGLSRVFNVPTFDANRSLRAHRADRVTRPQQEPDPGELVLRRLQRQPPERARRPSWAGCGCRSR